MAVQGNDIVGELCTPPNAIPEGKESPSRRAMNLQKERENIVLWKRPITTVHYFIAQIICLLGDLVTKLWLWKGRVALALMALSICAAAYFLEGHHQAYIKPMERNFLWCIYWVGLGILSSVGLGTGLHTFLLYLGPHIAAVTMAASTCKSLNFPEPPYPDQIICPEGETDDTVPSIWAIMSKVRLEAFLWGAGTAIGELPPYFVAKAARLAGTDDEEDLEVQREIEMLEKSDKKSLSLLDRAKLAVDKLIQKVGFLGILACASIPNPLFDVAGIMCGHFLVSFRTFFGATLIGKAVIKMHIQKIFVIFAFEESHIAMAINITKSIPYVGMYIEEFLVKQKVKMHNRGQTEESTSVLAHVFEKFGLIMVLYFVVSIVNSLAQSYHKRLSKRKTA